MTNSLATDDADAITFVQGKTLMRLHRDLSGTDNPVRIDPLMDIGLSKNDWYTDAFLFDGAVAVRVNNTEFEFFMLPLVD